MVGRSSVVESINPRGGVAVYKNKILEGEVDLIPADFRDCVLFKINNSDLVIDGMYIPPNNSLYYNEIYFKNLQLILDYFREKHLIIIGDLNSRIGNSDGKFGFKYIQCKRKSAFRYMQF